MTFLLSTIRVFLILMFALYNESFVYGAEANMNSHFSVILVNQDAGNIHYITIISAELAFKVGLPGEAIVGQLLVPNNKITPQNFARNRIFVDYLHAFIRREAPSDLTLRQRAATVRSGQMPFIDGRAKQGPGAPPSTEDVLGVFAVKDGFIVGYEPNAQHRIFSARGFFSLPPSLEGKLIRELEAIAALKKQ